MKDKAKDQVIKYMKKKKMSMGSFADAAGVGRYSIVRWVRTEGSTVQLKTWEKIVTYMALNP